jgi:hypothetical protein
VYKGSEMESVITHEMAHVIAGQTFGFSDSLGANQSPILQTIRDSYQESINNGDIYKISKYAQKSADEFWAECFTMYKMGREKLPPKIETMVKGVLKQL